MCTKLSVFVVAGCWDRGVTVFQEVKYEWLWNYEDYLNDVFEFQIDLHSSNLKMLR